MPSLPAPFARMIEVRGMPCTVTDTEDLSPSFRRVHLAGERLKGREWAPCQVTTLLVSPTAFRRYTPDAVDAVTGRMSILFYRHSAVVPGPPSPGDAWLDGLAVGDPVSVMGLEATRSFRARAEPGTTFVCGDATTVGLWSSMIRWLGDRGRVRGVVEVPAQDVPLVRDLLPGVQVVAQSPQPGEALLSWLGDAPPEAVTHAYLSGHGQTIQRARNLVRTRYDLHRSAIYTQPYWATGKVGL
ncbi:siderophore-interacting protein [Streptomyces sp. SID12501]|uniref:Siderophore-interacting protein n=1 Tax=Streptomyces sp. SID12501 TaxID=2706042 RepID=A0A6B3BVM1_9ACTN|nr:siderophore-interacting protein [Streptomyces sp. SID12501]NEC88441.1 siderophore-interacting protein [Streptomyces sp. SID12501]